MIALWQLSVLTVTHTIVRLATWTINCTEIHVYFRIYVFNQQMFLQQFGPLGLLPPAAAGSQSKGWSRWELILNKNNSMP